MRELNQEYSLGTNPDLLFIILKSKFLQNAHSKKNS